MHLVRGGGEGGGRWVLRSGIYIPLEDTMMDLTLLVDNNTFIDRYLTAEPGLSILIEDEDVTVLFDLGYSNLFLKMLKKWERIYPAWIFWSFPTVTWIIPGD